MITIYSLPWRHNGCDGVSNNQTHDCLLNRLFRHRSKITSKLRVTGLCAGKSPVPVNSLHKGPVTRKMFPFDDVIMWCIHNGRKPVRTNQMKYRSAGVWAVRSTLTILICLQLFVCGIAVPMSKVDKNMIVISKMCPTSFRLMLHILVLFAC